MANDNKVVLVVDKRRAAVGMEAMLGERGISTVVLDPTEDFTRPTDQYTLRAVVYEPFFAMFRGKQFRPIVDRILERAKTDGAIRIVCSTQSPEILAEQGFNQGPQYDRYVSKPASAMEILEGIL